MYQFSRVYSAQPHHLKGHIVTVEVDIASGAHKFTVVGLASKAVEEARDRIGSALKNSGFTSPKTLNNKTVISLAPAEMRKNGAFFDVAMALGYLLSRQEIMFDPERKLFLGELALNGEVLPVRGVLPLAQAAKDAGFTEIYVPQSNAEEAALVQGINVFPVKSLLELIQHLIAEYEKTFQVKAELKHPRHLPHRKIERKPIEPQPETKIEEAKTLRTFIDFADIRGQEVAKRGLEIAAAGGHNVAMYGPPGTGKTMLAKAFIHILPALDREDTLTVTGIHSIAGTLSGTVITQPPFRSPHHTASYVSIIGGTSNLKAGEVTLAHKGVLFMDEFPEFEKQVLESLRQPLEDRMVNIARASGTATFPTEFILVAAMNPPPPDATQFEIARHKKKISGPIIDRIDIWFPVEHIDYEKLSDKDFPRGETTDIIRARIIQARSLQKIRFHNTSRKIKLNAQMNVQDLEKLDISDEVTQILNTSAKKLNLSPRSYHRMIKLARTIADLGGAEKIEKQHILEALQYRPKEL